jgi:hypothetical protein
MVMICNDKITLELVNIFIADQVTGAMYDNTEEIYDQIFSFRRQ